MFIIVVPTHLIATNDGLIVFLPLN